MLQNPVYEFTKSVIPTLLKQNSLVKEHYTVSTIDLDELINNLIINGVHIVQHNANDPRISCEV